MYLLKELKKEVNEKIDEATGKEPGFNHFSKPPSPELGDLSTSIAFQTDEKNPEPIASKIEEIKLLEEVKTKGPYINLFIDWKKFSKKMLNKVTTKEEDYGRNKKNKEEILVEYSQPNTHKAFHIGHLRNTALGESLSRILEFNGYDIKRLNYINDMGAHVAKTIWALQEFHENEKPPENKGKWLGEIYAEACKKEEDHEDEISELMKQLEGKNPGIMDEWRKTRDWSIQEFKEIYDELDVEFDKWYFESDIKQNARRIVEDLLDREIAEKDEGAIIVDNEPKGTNVIQRSDGTILYSTSDLALAKKKFEDFDPDRNIYVVGSEQKFHFQMLFETLKKMGFKNADKCFHLAYELVRLKSGKMSSREGKTILYEDFAEEARKKALEAVKEKNPELKDKKEVAEKVALGAMKYEMLEVNPNKNIVFDWEKALDFEGQSAPYLQYAYVRCRSILKESEKEPVPGELEEGKKLMKKVSKFPEIVEKSAENYSPHLIAVYAYELAEEFSSFYSNVHVIGNEKEKELLALVQATAITLKNALNLLAIKTMEEM